MKCATGQTTVPFAAVETVWTAPPPTAVNELQPQPKSVNITRIVHRIFSVIVSIVFVAHPVCRSRVVTMRSAMSKIGCPNANVCLDLKEMLIWPVEFVSEIPVFLFVNCQKSFVELFI